MGEAYSSWHSAGRSGHVTVVTFGAFSTIARDVYD